MRHNFFTFQPFKWLLMTPKLNPTPAMASGACLAWHLPTYFYSLAQSLISGIFPPSPLCPQTTCDLGLARPSSSQLTTCCSTPTSTPALA